MRTFIYYANDYSTSIIERKYEISRQNNCDRFKRKERLGEEFRRKRDFVVDELQGQFEFLTDKKKTRSAYSLAISDDGFTTCTSL